MGEQPQEDKSRLQAMLRRWAYMAVALVATILITAGPIFSFHGDRGIYYNRTGEMDLHEFRAVQTILDSLDEEVKETMPAKLVTQTMSVEVLNILQKVLFWTIIACIVFFYPTRVRCYITLIIMALVAAFYAFVVIYGMRISDDHYTTFSPTWVVFMPAVVLAMAVLINRNVAKFGNYFDDIIE